MESPIVIENRDALAYMLSEASELEHAICCQYLYAAFSLKQSIDEDVTERQMTAIARWRTTILKIAAEEMLHMAQVNNLLSAIGAAPRVGRPNFPVAGRYYPPGIQLGLLPFGEPALRHFVFLERPEGLNLKDAEIFEHTGVPEPLMTGEQIVPRPQDFATVGHLYRSIEEGIHRLVARHGERWLFVGPRKAQARPETFRWDDLVVVTDLASAIAGIEVIVEQGEGPRGHWADAHYGRLLTVLGEYLTMRKEDPTFEPARPVVAACVRPPADAAETPLITDGSTARAMDVLNASYDLLLHILARYFGGSTESEEQVETLADVAVSLMIMVISPLGHHVTSLPLGPDQPDRTAGPNFEVFYGSGYLLPHQGAAWIWFHERLLEIRGFVMALSGDDGAPSGLGEVPGVLEGLAAKLAAHVPDLAHRTVAAQPAWIKGQTVPAMRSEGR